MPCCPEATHPADGMGHSTDGGQCGRSDSESMDCCTLGSAPDSQPALQTQRLERLKSDLMPAVPNLLDRASRVGGPALDLRPQAFRSECQVRLALISSYLL